MLEYIYKIYEPIYKFLFVQKNAIDDKYISAFYVVSNPKFDIWLNAEGHDQEKKSNCLKELKHYLENIETISNYILFDDSQEESRQNLLLSLKQEINTASVLAQILEQNPNQYDALVSGAKQYAKSKRDFQDSTSPENHKPITEDEETSYNKYEDIDNTEDYHVSDINITNHTDVTIEDYE